MSSITENRSELKYKIAASQAPRALSLLGQHLSQHRFEGEGSNQLPRARHYVTTVYFDTKDRELYRAVRQNEDSLKVRAREYYDLHPELLELATDARELVHYTPVLWVETKWKHEGRTRKRRVGIPKLDVAAFFEHGQVSPAMRALQERSHGAAAGEEIIAELLTLRTRYRTPLAASCIVNYRRTAFQNESGTIRITLDQRLSCFTPPSDLWSRERALVHQALGVPAYEEPELVLEVKAVGATPTWLDALLEACHARLQAFSKFATASEAVHGPLV